MQLSQLPQLQFPCHQTARPDLNKFPTCPSTSAQHTHFYQSHNTEMADTNTEVPSAEGAPIPTAGKQAAKPEPSDPTAHPTDDAPAEAAPVAEAAASAPADSAPANKDEASVAPVKETSAAPADEEKALSPASDEGTTDSKAAASADVPVATKEAAPAQTQTPFDEFDAKLPEILKEVDHDEMWGVKLVSPASSDIPTGIVLQKFLNANDGDVTKAIEQFTGALKFRKEKKPLDLVAKTFSANKFADLGAVTVYAKDSTVPEVFTWNLYGNVKGKMDEVFVPLDEFVHHNSLSPLSVRM